MERDFANVVAYLKLLTMIQDLGQKIVPSGSQGRVSFQPRSSSIG